MASESSPLRSWRRRDKARPRRREEKAWGRWAASRKPARARAAPRLRRERSRREEGEGVEASTARREPARTRERARACLGSNV